ncbi:MAG: amino acid adenylation domain-containing protein, partial [Vicinamibacterales bacterium]
HRLEGLARDAAPRAVLTTSPIAGRRAAIAAGAPALANVDWIETDRIDESAAASYRVPDLRPDSLALLQYTSGSTASPRGVMVTHANVMANQAMIAEAFAQSADAVVVGWLPPHHDMGLIGNLLHPIFCGGSAVLMPPLAFLQRPARWLECVTRYRATVSGGPNFAYELACRIPEMQCSGLDLSSWTAAFNGSERVRPATLERFADRFAPAGFRRAAFKPCYGLAEATLLVCSAESPLVRGHDVSCGRPPYGSTVRIADPESGRQARAGEAGEIWVAGPHIAKGYWNRPAETEHVFGAHLAGDPASGPWLRTGDLGILDEGDLFVLGRLKDVVILEGRNVHAEDIEIAVEEADALLAGRAAAAFGLDAGDGERLVVVQELDDRYRDSMPRLAAAIRRRVAETLEAAVHQLVFVPKRAIPRTANGKIRRHACRDALVAGRLQCLWQDIGGIEAFLVEQIASLLGMPGRVDMAACSLTAAGGDSLTAVHLAQMLERQYGVEVSPADLLEADSIASTAETIATAVGPTARSQVPAAGVRVSGAQSGGGALIDGADQVVASPARVSAVENVPLNAAQRAIWAAEQLSGDRGVHNLVLTARVKESLPARALQVALDALVARHPVLRTVVASEGGDLVQRVNTQGWVELQVVDGSLLSEANIQQRLVAGATRPIDLRHGPMLRVLLVQRDAGTMLQLVSHHLVLDFWSVTILLTDLAALLRVAIDDGPMPANSPTAALLARHEVTGAPRPAPIPVLDLPYDRPPAAAPAWDGETMRFSIGAATARRLRTVAQSHDATLFMSLLAVFQVLLGRYCRQHDVAVGFPIDGREHAGASVAGNFVDLRASRVDLSDNPSFSDLLSRTRRSVIDLLRPSASPIDHGRLQAVFTWQHGPAAVPSLLPAFVLGVPGCDVELSGFRLEPCPVDSRTAVFDLHLSMCLASDALAGIVRYRSALFKADSMARLVRHFQALVDRLAHDPARRVLEVPLLSEEEAEEITRWPARRFDVDCLHALFERRVVRGHERPALTSEGRHISYRELNRRANRLARRLQHAGVAPETLVGLHLERSPELIIGLLAILKAGGAYLPLIPTNPAAYNRRLVDDAGVRIVVARAAPPPGAIPDGVTVVAVDADGDGDPGRDDVNPVSKVTAQNLAYVLHTSGSTGSPKGVLVTHANATALFHATRGQCAFDASDVGMLFHSPAFDFSVWEIWGALLHGGRLVIVPEDVARSPQDFRALVQRERVTILNQTPTAFRQLVYDGGEQWSSALRMVIFGGERLDIELLRPWFGRQVGTPSQDSESGLRARTPSRLPAFVNMYGITETTVHVTCRRLEAGDLHTPWVSPIGTPLPHLSAYVLDDYLNPVSPGMPGQLFVGGQGMSRGYLHAPERTAAAFVPSPFATDPGERLYCTGDLVRIDAHGGLQFLGRIDQQVKIRGHRIEPGEIESVLLQHDGVREAVVRVATTASAATVCVSAGDGGGPPLFGESVRTFLQPDARRDEPQLIAYVSGEAGLDTDLRSYALERLPEFMVPARFVRLERLPRTASGKVDRAALPRPESARPEMAVRYAPPETPVERELAEIWAAVLEVAPVGLDDGFFALGGDSIRAIRMQAQAEARGLTVTLPSVFEQRTIRRLAPFVRPHATGCAEPSGPFSLLTPEDRASLPAGLTDAYPLSRLQAGLIFHSEMVPESAIYRDFFLYELRMPFNAAALEATLRALTERHPVLRTSIDLTRFSEPLQLVHASVDPSLEVVDLRGADARQCGEAIEERQRREERRPLDWRHPPLVRFLVFRQEEARFTLALSFHDVLFDGWSVATLLVELISRYHAAIAGRGASELPALPVTYRDFVAAERVAMASVEAREFWRGQLETIAPSHLAATPRSRAEAPRIVVKPVPIEAELQRSLERLAASSGTSLRHVLLAVHVRVLSLLAGREEIVTGLESNGRLETDGGDRVLGVHLNTLPFRCRVGRQPWVDLCRAVLERECGLLPFRRYPYAEIQKASGSTALFDTSFNFTHFHSLEELASLGELKILGSRGVERTHFSLKAEFNVDPFSDALHLDLECDAAALPPQQIERLAEAYEAALRSAAVPERAAEPGHPHSSRGESMGYPERRIDRLFAKQAAASADRTALIAAGTSLTFGQLDQWSMRLASRLVRNGLEDEDVVALRLARTQEAVVAMLAVLEAGGTTLWLDVSHPVERQEWLIRDSRARFVLDAGAVVAARDDSTADERRLGGRNDVDRSSFLIYTSGSTGKPKAATSTHRSIVNRLHWMWHAYPFQPDEVCCAKTPAAFGDSIPEILSPLLHGVPLVIVDEPASLDPARLVETLEAHGVTRIVLTPSWLQMLLEAEIDLGRRAPRLSLWVTSGEALTPALCRRFHQKRPGSRLLNLYGSSEVGQDVTHYEVTPGATNATVPIGRPIANTDLYVLDDELRALPRGTPGELFVGGPGLVRGYKDSADATAERFIPDPFSGIPGQRLYRTGDRVRLRDDGELEYLGRLDQQVKIRGHRIEPLEVEATLADHPAVSKAAVIAQGTTETKRLVAYVRLRPDSGAGASEIQAFVARKLPAAMVPATIVILEELPRLATGKVDRRALPEPDPDRRTTQPVAPRDQLETLLAEIWSDVLGRRPIGVLDTFADLGGDSLVAVQLMARVREAFGVEVPLRALFDGPTVAALARAIAAAQGRGGEAVALPALVPAPAARHAPFALTDVQQAYWIGRQAGLEHGGVGSHLYMEVEGDLETGRLEAALRQVIARHDMLRAVIRANGQQQVLAEVPAYRIAEQDLRGLDEAGQVAALTAVRDTLSHQVFSGMTWPLFEVRASRLADDCLRVHVSIDAVMADAWSMRILTRELFALYADASTTLPAVAVTFRDYVQTLAAVRETPWYARALEYWRARAATLPG